MDCSVRQQQKRERVRAEQFVSTMGHHVGVPNTMSMSGVQGDNMTSRIKALSTALLVLLGAFSLRGEQQPFSVTLATQHDIVKAGEDIHLQVTLTNTSHNEIKFAEAPGDTPPAEYQYLFQVRDSKGHPAQDTEYGHKFKENTRPRGSRVTWTLQPGESMKDETVLTKLFDLSRPDKYVIEAFRRIPEHLGKGTVKSNTLTITVTE